MAASGIIPCKTNVLPVRATLQADLKQRPSAKRRTAGAANIFFSSSFSEVLHGILLWLKCDCCAPGHPAFVRVVDLVCASQERYPKKYGSLSRTHARASPC
jgi:hypothetical protein